MLKIFYQGFGSAIFFQKIIFKIRKVRRLFVTQTKKQYIFHFIPNILSQILTFDKIRIDNQAAKVFLVIIL